jgi:cytochrome c biogenesis protein ResB
VIRRTWRGIVRLLGSTRLAIWLLAIVAAWSALGTLVPQGPASAPAVAAWASTHGLAEPVVRVLGLHQAFTSPVLVACILVLVVSTALCAWQRTKSALVKARTLRKAAQAEAASVAESHDLEIGCDPALRGPEVLSIASETLARLGIPTKRRDDLLANVSSPWSVWGSPVFHWGLVALIMALIVGNLLRSEGLMGITVGQTKADAPQSYGLLNTGPLHDWGVVHRSIRVDAFDLDYQTGGIDRGPTPIVTVLDGAGKAIKTQRVYPNATLKTGSLTIYPSAYGLAVGVTLVDAKGVEAGRSVQIVDFSNVATDGTAPAAPLNVNDGAGKVLLSISVSVPLDRNGDAFFQEVPRKPMARVAVTSADGQTVLDRLVSPGGEVALPSGDTLRITGIGYYARLQVVDDWTIPLLYVGLVVAMIGLTITVVARQQILMATVMEAPDGVRLAIRVRLWRNASSSRAEIESELTRALGGEGTGSTT